MSKILMLVSFLSLVSCGGDGNGQGQTQSPVVAGSSCSADADCASGQVCGYPTSDACSAKGVCLVYPTPGAARCNSVILACGCSGNKVGIPCDYPSGFAPSPISSRSALSCM